MNNITKQTKPMTNNNKVLAINHLHLHTTKIINTTININKPLNKPKKVFIMKCIVCGNMKKKSNTSNYCSNTCYRERQNFLHEQYKFNRQKLTDDKKKLNTSWWSF